MMDPPSANLLKFFVYGHLPPALQLTSRQFSALADWIVEHVKPGAERTAGLRKLLEAKDAIVRAQLPE